jgi:hypothetical protein
MLARRAKSPLWRMSYWAQDCKTTAFTTGIRESTEIITLEKDAETERSH